MYRTIARDAPAKINLALHVTGRRPDGYHLIESFVVFADVGDRVSVAEAETDTFSVSGPFAGRVPADAGNLVLRARDSLRALAGDRARPVAIALAKNLPAASGIGGGSADAAAALKALARLWDLDLPPGKLAALGLALGADLPMCLAGRPLVARGVGEEIDALDAIPPLATVLVNPGAELSTPSVFAGLAATGNPPLPPLPATPRAAALAAWLESTRNDLEAPALELAPAIGDVLAALRGAGARLARMSGSGATCFGLFDRAEAARRAASEIGRLHPGWWVTASTTRASRKG